MRILPGLILGLKNSDRMGISWDPDESILHLIVGYGSLCDVNVPMP